MDEKTYGRRILEKRKGQRLNQADVVRHVRIAVATLSDIENSRVGITEDTFDEIMDGIDLAADEGGR